VLAAHQEMLENADAKSPQKERLCKIITRLWRNEQRSSCPINCSHLEKFASIS